MKIHQGSSRLVIEIGPICIKVVYLWSLFSCLGQIGKGREYVLAWLKPSLLAVIRGSCGNLTEFCNSLLYYDKTFMAKSYLTLVFLNIQERVEGEVVDDIAEVDAFLQTHFSEGALRMFKNVDGHSLYSFNWIRLPDGSLKLVDYGDEFGAYGIPMSSVLAKISLDTSQKKYKAGH